MPVNFNLWRRQGPQQGPTAGLGISPGLDPGEYQSLALLNALSQVQESGLQRHASPMGSIAGGLAPLVQALIQARGMQAQAQMAQMAQRLQLAQLASKVDPEKRAAEIEHLKSLASSEQALAEERKGKQAYRDQQSEMIQKILGGQGGADTSGMKPKITYGPSGPSVSMSSDVMSPAAFQQHMQLQAAGAAQTLSREEKLKEFTANLPKPLTPKERESVAAGESLIELLDQAPEIVKTIPKDMTRQEYAKNMAKYQARSEHPLASNIVSSLTGGMISTDTDSRLDPVASWIGQVKAALASFNVQGMKGGVRMLNYLKDHFGDYGDSPESLVSKAAQLTKDNAYIKTQVRALGDQITRAGAIAEKLPSEIGATPVQGNLRVPWVDKNGVQHHMMIDPTTGSATNAD